MKRWIKNVILLIAAGFFILPAKATADIPGFEQRLERLAKQLEQKRQEYHVPGLAVGVVKEDKIVFTEGFGWADIANKKPVTPETLFALGSSSKAFTATLIGMLVDEGKLNWDDPVTKHIPYFAMKPLSDDPDAALTIRDLLCHRTGFARMNMLWVKNEELSREEVLRLATKAEPWANYGAFVYNNVMVMAAGVAAGKAVNADWDTLIQERIFDPLGMMSSNTSIKNLSFEKAAKGYIWDDVLKRNSFIPMKNFDNAGPAGSINSNVLDMARWLRFHLNHGIFGGKRMISTESLSETQTTQMNFGGGTSYGLGWFLHRWNDKSIVEHGGGIDGFTSQVTLVPDENIGFVFLINQTSSSLSGIAQNIILETLLGDWIEPFSEEQKHKVEPLTGVYTANNWNNEDAEFEVKIRDGFMTLILPGTEVYTLKPPDSEGKWCFVEIPQDAVSFEKDEQGNVLMMKYHTGNFTYEVPRKGAEIPLEIPLARLQKYLGLYSREKVKETVEIVIRNDHLALDIPGQTVYELHPPGDEGRWYFRSTDRMFVTFDEPDKDTGEIDFFNYHTGRGQVAYARITESTPRLPTADDILALRRTEKRKDALEKMGLFRMTGTVEMFQSAVEGTLIWYAAGTDQHHQLLDFGRFGRLQVAVDGNMGWKQPYYLPLHELHGKYLEQARQMHPAAILGDWRDFFSSFRVLHEDKRAGRKVYVLLMTGKEAPVVRVVVDAETGDVLQTQMPILRLGAAYQLPDTTVYEDFRDVHGIRIPFKMTITNQYIGRTVLTIEEIETNLEMAENPFQVKGDPINKKK
jgi:CubicO group peptidase (beta-lactamase class C family)